MQNAETVYWIWIIYPHKAGSESGQSSGLSLNIFFSLFITNILYILGTKGDKRRLYYTKDKADVQPGH